MHPIRRTVAGALVAGLVPLGLVLGTAVPAHSTTGATPAPHAAVPRHAATPSGPLPQTGCTEAGTAATCDLYAKPGTLTVSSTAIPIWGLASTDTAPASTPGPVLTVTQGDAVSITVHNGLSQNLSLAVPGVSGLVPDTTGAAPGAAKTYTFTAARPGTYLYEAGHTADGARQAAMGIVGALVVRPADHSVSAYGDAASVFDDEAVLVLSEIDPAFNANPGAFDLRNLRPTYRLINGKAFPETNPIATDSGRRVLLRYVNAGLADHAMGVLGTTETPVGTGARRNPDAYPVVSDTIPAGATEDAVATVPGAGDGARFAVYETAGRLDDAGAAAGAGSTQAGFGGMLTFLSTNATPPTTDTVGPIATRVGLSPASVSALQKITVTADLTDVPNGGSAVTAAEFVVDDPGAIAVGHGGPLTGAFGSPTVTGATGVLDPADPALNLAAGTHTVYVRALDSAGNWGVVNSATFTLTTTGPATTGGLLSPSVTNGAVPVALSATGDDTGLNGTVDRAEYFLGVAGANGTGTPLTLTPGTVAAQTATIPATAVQSLPEGSATVWVHSHDSFGLWGPLVGLPLTVDRTAPALVSGSVAPSPNNGTLGSPVDATALQVSATFTDPVSAGVNSPIAAAEGFVDNPAGTPGTGFVWVANDGRFDSTTEAAYGLVPLSELTGMANGTHTVYVHARDVAGNWGPLAPLTFVVDHGKPTVTGATASFAPATGTVLRATATGNLTAVAGAEFFDSTDPGAGNGHPMAVTRTGATTASLYAATGGLARGTHTIGIRARDAAGNWSAAVSVTVNVTSVAAGTFLFADGFDSGNTTAWSAPTGQLAVVPTGLPASQNDPFALQVTASGTNPATVTDTTPNAETAYHAQFSFTPTSLTTSATGWVTVFSGTTGTGTQVFSVQYLRTATGYQLRVGATGANGAISYSTPITVAGTGTVAVRLDWASATAATVKLTAGTASTQLTRVNSSALRLETVVLGLTGGDATTAGTATFDTFTSTR